MATPFNTLINRTIARLSMVSGTSVQTYAEDRIAEMLQHKFDVLFMEYWWPQFMVWKTSALDGTLGVVTDDLTTELKDFLDLRVIYIENTNTPLTVLPSTVNPYTLSGTTPIHFEASTIVAKVFHVWPLASTGNIIYAFRSKPDDFVSTDSVNFDAQTLILGTCFDYLEDDGMNPNASQKFQALFESRVKQLKKTVNAQPMSLDPLSALPNQFTFTEL